MDELTINAQSTDPAELGSLAVELARAHAMMIGVYRRELGLSDDEADARMRGDDQPDWQRRALDEPPQRVSWVALSTLAEHDPAAALAAWERVKLAARDDLASGHRAAAVLEWDGRPWERARFLAIRDGFRDEWRLRGGLEDGLIDMMTQAYSAYLAWTNVLQLQATAEAKRQQADVQQHGRWEPPRLETAASLEQAAAMVERFQRMFLRALRALRDLRRYTPSVVVRNAEQVNVGGQQLNIAGGSDRAGTSARSRLSPSSGISLPDQGPGRRATPRSPGDRLERRREVRPSHTAAERAIKSGGRDHAPDQ
jgi:hypothetical protein